jgi:hypothetical protein
VPVPTERDAAAARALVEAVADGVQRARAADVPPPAPGGRDPVRVRPGTPALTRRTPGASLPPAAAPAAAPAHPTRALDPDEARATIEQFEYGVTLALRDARSQHEGRPR